MAGAGSADFYEGSKFPLSLTTYMWCGGSSLALHLDVQHLGVLIEVNETILTTLRSYPDLSCLNVFALLYPAIATN
jgi:hypothetical protein